MPRQTSARRRGRAGRLDAPSVRAILDGLATLHPDATCELCWTTPYELLVATILSAQCTDKRVNTVTPDLFRRYPDAHALSRASAADLARRIRSTGFFRAKTRNLQACARALVEHHAGEVPRTMDELVCLPGVARKTANVVLGTAFGVADGVVVDTHVRRLARRMGMTREEDPEKIERDLMAAVPRQEWIAFAHRLIWHGRRVCHARRPACGECLLARGCESAFAA